MRTALKDCNLIVATGMNQAATNISIMKVAKDLALVFLECRNLKRLELMEVVSVV